MGFMPYCKHQALDHIDGGIGYICTITGDLCPYIAYDQDETCKSFEYTPERRKEIEGLLDSL